jgi:hypothetical protein
VRSPSGPWGPSVPTQGNNRPDMVGRPHGTLFHDTGQTGWGRKRDLRNHKRGRSEHDFHDQHRRFFDPAVDELDEQE